MKHNITQHVRVMRSYDLELDGGLRLDATQVL